MRLQTALSTGADPFSAAIDAATGRIYISLRQGASIQIFYPWAAGASQIFAQSTAGG